MIYNSPDITLNLNILYLVVNIVCKSGSLESQFITTDLAENSRLINSLSKLHFADGAHVQQKFECSGLIKNVQNEKSRQIRTLQKEIESYRSTNLRLTRKNERLQRKIHFYEMEFESRGITVEYETFEDLQEDEIDLRQSAGSPTSEGGGRGRGTPPRARSLADEGGAENQVQ